MMTYDVMFCVMVTKRQPNVSSTTQNDSAGCSAISNVIGVARNPRGGPAATTSKEFSVLEGLHQSARLRHGLCKRPRQELLAFIRKLVVSIVQVAAMTASRVIVVASCADESLALFAIEEDATDLLHCVTRAFTFVFATIECGRRRRFGITA